MTCNTAGSQTRNTQYKRHFFETKEGSWLYTAECTSQALLSVPYTHEQRAYFVAGNLYDVSSNIHVLDRKRYV